MRTKGLCEVLSTALAIGESRSGMAIEREGMNMTLCENPIKRPLRKGANTGVG